MIQCIFNEITKKLTFFVFLTALLCTGIMNVGAYNIGVVYRIARCLLNLRRQEANFVLYGVAAR